jgi:hypothetical protein
LAGVALASLLLSPVSMLSAGPAEEKAREEASTPAQKAKRPATREEIESRASRVVKDAAGQEAESAGEAARLAREAKQAAEKAIETLAAATPEPQASGRPGTRGAPPSRAGKARPAAAPATRGRPRPPARVTSRPLTILRPRNVAIDLTLTDERSDRAVSARAARLVVRDGGVGRIDAQLGTSPEEGRAADEVPLSAEARPRLLGGDRIRLQLAVRYGLPAEGEEPASPGMTQKLDLVLKNGVVVQAAVVSDSAHGRRIVLEVKATLAD